MKYSAVGSISLYKGLAYRSMNPSAACIHPGLAYFTGRVYLVVLLVNSYVRPGRFGLRLDFCDVNPVARCLQHLSLKDSNSLTGTQPSIANALSEVANFSGASAFCVSMVRSSSEERMNFIYCLFISSMSLLTAVSFDVQLGLFASRAFFISDGCPFSRSGSISIKSFFNNDSETFGATSRGTNSAMTKPFSYGAENSS